MSLRPRPFGLPTHIPRWAWKRLRRPGHKPQAGPHHLPAWFWLWRKWRLGYKLPPALSKREQAVALNLKSLKDHGQMVYVEYGTKDGQTRSSLFHRKPGDFKGAGADCSQFQASVMNWVGVKGLTDQDATGTLLAKGKRVDGPAYGRLAVFGVDVVPAGVHTGMFTRVEKGVWYLTEFGDQEAPDEISLPNAIAYFKARGKPGVAYLDFFE